MKNKLLSATAIALALATGSALAADLPSRKEAPVYVAPAPVATWTGFYAGLNLGGGWSSQGGNNSYLPYADSTFGLGSTPVPGLAPNLFFLPGGGTTGNNTGGVVGGGQIGYNYQMNQFVLGVETDFQGTSITGGNQGNYAGLYASPYPTSATGVLSPLVTGNGGNLGLPWFGTVRGRAGYLVTPTLLLYGTGGFAYGGVEAFQRSNTSTGWTAGGGVEWMFMPHWTAKLEYLYVDLDSSGINGAFTGWQLGNNHHPQLNVVRLGVNYLFNFGAPAPVLAKY
ncbi:MAG: outer membrane beta-barrel protein [Methylocystis sp.]